MNLFEQLYEKTISRLGKDLPAYLTYHDANHTRYVLEKTILIAEKEKVSDHELFLLKVAALYHDTGYLKSSENHETESCRIATQDLAELGFVETEIDQICNMIMATKIPQQPKSNIEGILADADLEYLGTSEFDVISDKLLTELKHFRPELTTNQWLSMQIDFISKHKYHTEYCQTHYKSTKLKNLEKIQEKARLLF
ncbi:MAG: HD domain-containing protein [Prolixibacteraceae bacterium]|nr:HD domain-containing protein [Prolixibacteraceae bacterium]